MRRHFLIFFKGLIVLVTMLACLSSAQANDSPYYRNIRFRLDGRFSPSQQGILRRAIRKVAERFLDPKIFRCTDENYKRWRMRGNYLTAAGLDFQGNTAKFEAHVKNVQLAALLAKGFPPLDIRSYDRDDGTTGFTEDKDMVIPKVLAPGQFNIQGSFRIFLNMHYLGNGDTPLGFDINYWAGTVAHEMLHNLGHHHLVNEYNGLFIRIFENCVRFNGKASLQLMVMPPWAN